MIKTNCIREITKDGSQRIIYAANGRWQLQRLAENAPANDREHDYGWLNQGPPQTYAEARKAASAEMREGW